jgi:hypothetical protein
MAPSKIPNDASLIAGSPTPLGGGLPPKKFGGPPLDLGEGEEGMEKESIGAVKDLLQQAMDMLTKLDTAGPGMGADIGGPPVGGPPKMPPGMGARPPLKPMM